MVGHLNFGQSVRIARFFCPHFLSVALRIRAYMDLLQDFGETQNLVNAWNQSANFLYQNRASRSNNDISAYCLALYPLKQVLIFRFMPSQFETHGAAASRTQGRTDRAPCPPRTDSPNEYPEPSDRQQKSALHYQEPRQKHQKTENAAEDPQNRHTIRPRRADPRRNADRMQKPPPEP